MVRVTEELDCFNAHIRLKEPDKSEDKAEGGTSVKSSTPYFHEGRALIVQWAKEVENAKVKLLAFQKFNGSGKANLSS
ncbi:hypothetical protein B296_00003475 [Ensete ventricosum]|uniref:Uncharacterized protein n=1 Tax=Ensete ventricosum TaxID=4639 RepID=A0A426Z3R9_ENSVE|nr:hypothetical protein B296_00003475 [Ensete ventricosum]